MKCTETKGAGRAGAKAVSAGLFPHALFATAAAAPFSVQAQATPAQDTLISVPGTVAALLLAVVVLAFVSIWLVLRLRRTAQRLRQAHLQLHGLGNVLDVWLWRSDADHRITRIRPPAGSAPSQWSQPVLGRALWEHFATPGEAALRAQLDANAPLHDVEVSTASADGGTQLAWLRGTALTNAQGRFDGYLGIARERTAVAEPVRTASATTATPVPVSMPMAEPASTAARDLAEPPADGVDESFAYTISHDLRAPIRVVEGFTRILKEDYSHVLDRLGNDHLDRVLGAAARMNGMIDALLGLYRLSAQPLERQPVNLSQLAAYVAEDLRRLSPQRQVELHIEPDMQVQGDPTLLRMVLENLLGNAWKYTGKRSDAQIWFERSTHERREVFAVRDNGAGFDMRFADRLFGAFQRLHSASEFQGTGVGLVSVRRIVRRHGGDIWAQSAPGQGANFQFTLAP